MMCFLNFWFVIKNKKQCRSEAAFPHSRCFSSCFQRLADKESLEEGLLYRYVEDLVGFVSRSAVLWCHSGVLCSLSPADSFLWNKRHKIPPKVSSKCTLPWILRCCFVSSFLSVRSIIYRENSAPRVGSFQFISSLSASFTVSTSAKHLI